MNDDVVRCNQCFGVYVVPEDEESCPNCGETGCLMDAAMTGGAG